MLLLLVIAPALSACTGPAGTLGSVAGLGQTEKTTLDQYQNLLAQQDGWRLFETGYRGRTACLAVKPAAGQDWPVIRQGRTLSGGTGFAMYLLDGLDVPFLGFYGPYGFGRDQAELSGTLFRYVDNREQVLGWDGQTVQFRVTAQPGTQEGLATPLWERNTPLIALADRDVPVRALPADPSADGTTHSGSVDFTGVSAVYELLRRCHTR